MGRALNVHEYRKRVHELKLKKISFGLYFRHQRELRDMKQIDMAELLNCTQGTISKIESGGMFPDLELYLRFKKEFELETDSWEFVEFTEEELAEKGIKRRKPKQHTKKFLKSA